MSHKRLGARGRAFAQRVGVMLPSLSAQKFERRERELFSQLQRLAAAQEAGGQGGGEWRGRLIHRRGRIEEDGDEEGSAGGRPGGVSEESSGDRR